MSHQRHVIRQKRGERDAAGIAQPTGRRSSTGLVLFAAGLSLAAVFGFEAARAAPPAGQQPATNRQMQRAARRQYLDTELSARRLTPPAPASPSPPPSLKPSSVPQTSAPAPANDEDAHAADVDHATADPQPSELIALQDKIRRVLALYFPKHQNTRDNTNWEVMHEIIAYGVDARLFRGGPDGPKVNAIGWLCYNGGCKGEQMLYLDRGKLVARKGPGVQGHFGQLLAILAQSRLPIDYPMLVGGKKFTIRDLVEHEKSDCTAGEELTFKLIGLMHYLDSDDTWTSRAGDTWSIQRLIHEELKQPIRGAACGGTHRLMGFSYAVNKRILRGKPVVGEFARAQKFVNQYHRYTLSLQNPDGSFSTDWFTRREARADVDRRLKTTGHVGEWLTFSMTDEELRDPRMTKAIDYLATILLSEPNRTWEIGPLGHGLHALALYDGRLSTMLQTSEQSVVRLPNVMPPAPSAASGSAADAARSWSAALESLRAIQAQLANAPAASEEQSAVSDAADAACPPLGFEPAKPGWGQMPGCEIGNESSIPAESAPGAAAAPRDSDDEMCL